MDYTQFQRRSRIITYLLLAGFLAGCATVKVPNMGEDGYALEEDETRLHKRALEYQELIDDSDYIYADAALEAYLNRLADSLLSEELKNEGIVISVKVLNDPTYNAFSFANGRIYIHTGILAATDNEAQLAALVGHEIAHVTNRHILKQFRSLTNKSAFMSVMSPLGLPGLLMQLGTITTISGYSKHHEFEADKVGFEMARLKDYSLKESITLFERLDQHIEEEDVKLPYFFSTHPRVKERIVSYERLLKKLGDQEGEKKVTTDEFERYIIGVIEDNALLALSKGFFETARADIERLIAKQEDSAKAYYLKGKLLRERQTHKKKKEYKKDEDYTAALDAFSHAIELDGNFAPAYEGKARVLRKLGQTDEAKEVYVKYLELEPNSPDRPYIEKFINE